MPEWAVSIVSDKPCYAMWRCFVLWLYAFSDFQRCLHLSLGYGSACVLLLSSRWSALWVPAGQSLLHVALQQLGRQPEGVWMQPPQLELLDPSLLWALPYNLFSSRSGQSACYKEETSAPSGSLTSTSCWTDSICGRCLLIVDETLNWTGWNNFDIF